MTKLEALEYHKAELAKHGWHVLHMLHIDDIKDYIKGGTDIVEMPSDGVLNDACAYVAGGHHFTDYTECVEWAVSMIYEWKEEGSI
jgi:hypothetical protein